MPRALTPAGFVSIATLLCSILEKLDKELIYIWIFLKINSYYLKKKGILLGIAYIEWKEGSLRKVAKNFEKIKNDGLTLKLRPPFQLIIKHLQATTSRYRIVIREEVRF